MKSYDLGLIGLGVMGRNFLLNLADHGLSVLGYDTDPAKGEALRNEAGGLPVGAVSERGELLACLARPRTILLLVPAGAPVDAALDGLVPALEPGDRVVDGGNSHFRDTERRAKALADRGIRFLGMGVSGGEEGARRGPSLMPGGDRETFEALRPWLEAVAAKANGEPCVAYMGPGAAGHYVKMVHNAIEYGWMQLIAEAVDLLRRGRGLSWEEIAGHVAEWNRGELGAFLVEITADILNKKDPETGGPLVEVISDVARQKGTGKWATEEARSLQVPIPTIEAAVTWRDLSRWQQERSALAEAWPPAGRSGAVSVEAVRSALYGGLLLTLAQGMALLAEASRVYGYSLHLGTVVRLWRGGCILRAKLLNDVARAYENPGLPHLLLDPAVGGILRRGEAALRETAAAAIGSGLSAPAFHSALAYWDALRDTRLPMSLVQAQRDYFGAHGYERRDRPGSFHTRWK